MALAAFVFITVSTVSLAVQVTSLFRLHHVPADGTVTARLAYQGLLRTSRCRVGVAVTYLLVGVTALCAPARSVGLVTLAVFCCIQVLWQVNSLLDVRLKHRIRLSGES